MCWICEHPGATRPDYLDHLRELIATYGWAVQSVERDGIHPPWAYTVGLTAAGRPELVVTGMSSVRSWQLLNDVASHVLHARAPRPGARVPLIDGPTIEFVELSGETARLANAVEIYGTGIRALQLVYADDHGYWPWDAAYRGRQPILGARASRAANAA
jgi:hypothetical protein